MTRLLFHRRGFLHAGLACGLSAFAGGVRACEFFAPNLRITHPWTRASAPGATTAAVGMKFDEVTAPDRLIGVETLLAEGAEMGGTGASGSLDLPIAEGRETVLAEAGPHVRLVGLKQALEAGRTYPMRLRFEKAGIVPVTLSVDYARFF